VAAILCFSTALAQAPPPGPAPKPIPTTSASPPLATKAEVDAQPVYKSSWEHFLALKAKARPARLPDISGVWVNQSQFAWEPGYPFMKARIPTYAPLLPEARKRYDKLFDNFIKGLDYDTLSDCMPAGYPRWMVEGPFEIAVTPRQTWMITDLENEVHRVYTDGRGHIPDEDAIPLWEGDAIGFWDGDTLIVHTSQVRGMPMSYQRGGPPTTDAVTGVEQWRMIDANHVRLQVTIYDPGVLSAPWRPAPRVYARVGGPDPYRIDHYICIRGDVKRNAQGGTDLLVPGDPDYVDKDIVLENAAKAIDKLSR
jgi:hypothetical protein